MWPDCKKNSSFLSNAVPSDVQCSLFFPMEIGEARGGISQNKQPIPLKIWGNYLIFTEEGSQGAYVLIELFVLRTTHRKADKVF